MIYITGDIHGKHSRVTHFCKDMGLTETDTLILLGDVGANYYGNYKDDFLRQALSAIPATVFCIHGNHEQRPSAAAGYVQSKWHGGIVWMRPSEPNLLFAKDGEVFCIEGIRFLVIGGAFSVDKYYRLAMGYGWWPDEQPSEEIKEAVEQAVANGGFDVVLSHTCPYKYRPVEMFLTMVDQSKVDDSTERWLDQIEEKAKYDAWYCGHWHTNKRIDKMHFLFESFETIEADKLTAARDILNEA